jgi:hypothetical protein
LIALIYLQVMLLSSLKFRIWLKKTQALEQLELTKQKLKLRKMLKEPLLLHLVGSQKLLDKLELKKLKLKLQEQREQEFKLQMLKMEKQSLRGNTNKSHPLKPFAPFSSTIYSDQKSGLHSMTDLDFLHSEENIL